MTRLPITVPRWPGLLALITIATLLTACTSAGAGSSGVATLQSPDPSAAAASPSASLSAEDAMVAFTSCMREHGIDIPDAKAVAGGGGGAFSVQVGGKGGIDPKKLDEAQQACGELLPKGGADGGPTRLDPATQDKILQFARCMRDHGIDFPDPDFGNGGFVKIGPDTADGGPRIDPQSKEFQDAQAACESLLPNGPDGKPGISVQNGGPAGGTTSDSGPVTQSNP